MKNCSLIFQDFKKNLKNHSSLTSPAPSRRGSPGLNGAAASGRRDSSRLRGCRGAGRRPPRPAHPARPLLRRLFRHLRTPHGTATASAAPGRHGIRRRSTSSGSRTAPAATSSASPGSSGASSASAALADAVDGRAAEASVPNRTQHLQQETGKGSQVPHRKALHRTHPSSAGQVPNHQKRSRDGKRSRDLRVC